MQGLGADHVLAYDAETDVIDALVQTVGVVGRKYDLVFDSVSSHDPRDARFQYESRIRSLAPSPIAAAGTYIFIGGLWHDWLQAHIKRFLGINLFARGRMLFWVRFPNASTDLQRLCDMHERGVLRPTLAHVHEFTAQGVREAFCEQVTHVQRRRDTN